jgi:general secretion pathway protein G
MPIPFSNKIVSKPAGTGFTLVELLVVLAIIAVLLTISMPRYFQSVDAAKEAVLVDNLAITRETIDKFYGDTGRYPESLDELVEKKYLRSLPFDPLTDSNKTWVIVGPDESGKGSVYDLHSSALGSGRTDIPFSER